jgi:HEAT repeat protein
MPGMRPHLSARWLAAVCLALPALAQDSIDDLLKEMRKKGDDTEITLLQKIGDTKSRAAAEGLIREYDAVSSIWMHREIARTLARFEGTDCEQIAMEKLANIAGNAEEPEVREAAFKGLGQSRVIGKHYLKQIVDSELPDNIREPALRAHVAMAEPADAPWYKFIWNLKNDRRKYADGSIQGQELGSIRELAFQGLASVLSENELIETLNRELADPKIRRMGLKAMYDRKLPKTAEMAAWMLGRGDMLGGDRIVAARILVDLQGAKALPEFLKLYPKPDAQTSEDLREEMARLVAQVNDDATNKKLMKLVGKGKPHERVFVIQATAKIDDPKLVAEIRKELQEKELDVRRAAAQALALRRDSDSLPALHAMLEKPKAPEDTRIAIEAISAIDRSSKWLGELEQMCTSADRETRQAALDQLASTADSKWLKVMFAALSHDDWSTRLIAIQALPAFQEKAAVPVLIDALEKEKGRMRKAVAESLWQLTAQPFDEDVPKWRAWWKEAEEKFKVATPSDLEKAKQERENRRLHSRTATSAKFFGIKVESHRVIFILDISGSMLESVYGKQFGKRGTTRIDIARHETIQAIQNLEPGTLFNVFTFQSSVDRWQKGAIVEATDANRQAAITWVERLGAQGATDLYDAVKLAFDDKEVDTIFIMSDGEPTNGEIIDPQRIREEVAFWNKHRHVKINTIAVGGNFDILEWLAVDSGGTHLRVR